jgi:Ca2+-binding RTX toxin-like protein
LISLSSNLIGHAAQAGSVAAVLTTADPDAGDIFKYSLATEEKDAQVFSIRGDKLILNQDARILSKSEYSVIIVSTDQAGLSRSQSFVIAVEKAPTLITASSQSISESAAIGEAVAQLSLQGPLGARQYSFSITDDLGTLGSSHFTIQGSQLILKKTLDFESSSSITLSLRATDTGGNRLENKIAFDVIDANEAPSEILLNNNTIKESIAPKALVANLSAIDPDQADSHSFTLANVEQSDNHLFYLQRNQLRIREQPDYETKPVYKLILRATDQSGNSLEREKLILVDNINESPIDIEITSNSLSELMPTGSPVGILRTVDADKNDLFSYSLVAGIGSQDNSSFFIDSDRLRFNHIGDHETKETYSIRLRSTDKEGLFVEKELIVLITNINESPTNLRSSADELFRETMAGTIVAHFLADDPDQGDELTYQLVQGEGSRDNGLFTLEANTLKLRSTIGDKDQKELSIRVRVSDKAGSFTEQKFSFSLPAVIISSKSEFPETTRMGSIISTLSVSGYTHSSNYDISLSASKINNDNALFSIDGNALVLATNADHEHKDSYVISVVAESPNGDTLQRNLEIFVADVNEAPTNLVITASHIDNTAKAGTVIANIAAHDPDKKDSLKFSIVSINGGNTSEAFTIVGNKLILQKSAQDLGTRNISILLRAIDSAGLTTEKSFDLQVTPTLLLSSLEISEDSEVGDSISVLSTTSTAPNEKYKYALATDGSDNDNHLFYIEGDQLKVRFTPDFQSKHSYQVKIIAANEAGISISNQFDLRVIETNMPPAFLALSTNQFEEGKPVNSFVGELIALDPNASDQIIYQLAIGNDSTDNNFFSISDNKLMINSLANFESKPSYNLRVKAIDQGGLFIEESFKINIIDRNDAPTAIFPSTRYININAPSRSVVATLATIDEDQKDQHAYSLVAGEGSDDNLLFTVSGSSLRINSSAAASKKNNFNVRISSRDNENATVEEVLSFSINREPTSIGISSNVFDENRPASSSLLSFSTADPDKSDSFVYDFTPGVGAKDNDKFIINGNQLRAKGVVDFESQSTYSIRVRSTDQGGLSTVQVFELNVKDVNEPPSLIVASQNSFVENIPQKTIVATLQSVDPEDAGPISYSLVAGVGDKDNQSFSILGNTLLINTSVDYERQKTYSIRIEAKDIDGKVSLAVLNLSVENVVESVNSSTSFDLPRALDKLILTGSLDINGKGNDADNEIIGNAGHNVLTGAGGKDSLTGLTGSDIFSYPKLDDSLITFFDGITDFEMGVDKLDIPKPISNSNLYYAGLLSSLSPESLMSSFTSTRLPADAAGFVEVLEPLPTGLRTFIVVNDSTAGYQPNLDAVIEITGYRGDLQSLLFV